MLSVAQGGDPLPGTLSRCDSRTETSPAANQQASRASGKRCVGARKISQDRRHPPGRGTGGAARQAVCLAGLGSFTDGTGGCVAPPFPVFNVCWAVVIVIDVGVVISPSASLRPHLLLCCNSLVVPTL